MDCESSGCGVGPEHILSRTNVVAGIGLHNIQDRKGGEGGGNDEASPRGDGAPQAALLVEPHDVGGWWAAGDLALEHRCAARNHSHGRH